MENSKMDKMISSIKKTVVFVLAGAVLIASFDLLRREKRRWNITWNVSASSFRISGKKPMQ